MKESTEIGLKRGRTFLSESDEKLVVFTPRDASAERVVVPPPPGFEESTTQLLRRRRWEVEQIIRSSLSDRTARPRRGRKAMRRG